MTEEPAQSLRSRTLSSVIWAAGAQYGSNAARYVTLLILALWLPPSTLGLLSLVMVFVLIAQNVGELGMAAAIVYDSECDETVLSTAFVANLAVSLVLAAVTLWLAGPITAFLGDASGAPVLQLLSLVFPISALAVVHRALLTRELRFRWLSLQQMAGETGFGIVAIGATLAGHGIWGLAFAVLAQRVAMVGTLWLAVSWWPRALPRWRSFKGLIRYSGPVLGGTLAIQGASNADYFVIGHWLGTEALGYYTLAFQTAVIPLQRVVGVITKVAFPSFTLIRDQKERLKRSFLEGLGHLYAMVLPVSLLVAAAGPWFIEALYGGRWSASSVPLQILAGAGALLAFDLAQPLLFALGKPSIRLYLTLARMALFALFAASFGLANGLPGIAASVALALAALGAAYAILSTSVLEISLSQLAGAVWPAWRAVMVASIPLVLLLEPSFRSRPPWVVLGVLAASISVFYIAAILPAYWSSLALLWKRLRTAR